MPWSIWNINSILQLLFFFSPNNVVLNVKIVLQEAEQISGIFGVFVEFVVRDLEGRMCGQLNDNGVVFLWLRAKYLCDFTNPQWSAVYEKRKRSRKELRKTLTPTVEHEPKFEAGQLPIELKLSLAVDDSVVEPTDGWLLGNYSVWCLKMDCSFVASLTGIPCAMSTRLLGNCWQRRWCPWRTPPRSKPCAWNEWDFRCSQNSSEKSKRQLRARRESRSIRGNSIWWGDGASGRMKNKKHEDIDGRRRLSRRSTSNGMKEQMAQKEKKQKKQKKTEGGRRRRRETHMQFHTLEKSWGRSDFGHPKIAARVVPSNSHEFIERE